MGDRSRIDWTEATWNPVTGCDEVSPGCDHCYAKTLAERFRGTPGHYFENGFDVQLRPERLEQPIRWKRPRAIFVNSMSDLFHKDVLDEYIARVFAVMALAPQHTFQVLTKRHGRMRSLLSSPTFYESVDRAVEQLATAPGSLVGRTERDTIQRRAAKWMPLLARWPLPNVWLGVSVEDQARANLRIPALLDTPAAVRFLSCEPLLGPIDLREPLAKSRPDFDGDRLYVRDRLHWVIAGGESGRGARPMDTIWARDLRDQCSAAGIPFFFKQWGEHDATGNRVGKKAAGRLLDGINHDGYPQPTGGQ